MPRIEISKVSKRLEKEEIELVAFKSLQEMSDSTKNRKVYDQTTEKEI